MDNVHVKRVFFSKISQIIGQFRQIGRMHCGVFVVLPVELSAYILSNNQPLFLQETNFFRHFNGIFIWDWDMNLGCKECWIQPSCVRCPCLKLFKKGRSKKENCCSYLELFQLKVVFHPYATIVKGLLLSSVSRIYTTVHSAFTLLSTTTYFDGEKRVSCREKLNGHFKCTTMVGIPNFGSTKYRGPSLVRSLQVQIILKSFYSMIDLFFHMYPKNSVLL